MNKKGWLYLITATSYGLAYWYFSPPPALMLTLPFLLIIFELFFSTTDVIESEKAIYTNLLFDHSPSMIAEIDLKSWEIIKINELLSSTLRIAYDHQIIGHSIYQLFDNIHEKNLRKALHNLQKKGTFHQVTSTLLTSDNQMIPVTLDGIVNDQTDEAVSAFLYITNISSIKKTEAKLQSNRNLLQNILDNTLEAVILTNENGKIIDWNPQAEQLIGIRRVNAINKPISKLIKTSQKNHFYLEKDINQFFAGGETKFIGKRGNFSIINNTNKIIPVESCCFPVKDDENSYVFCFFLHDITTEIKAREHEIRLSTIVEQTEDGIISIAENYQVESCNQAASQIFDLDSQQMLGHSIEQHLSEAHKATLLEKIKTSLSSALSHQYEFSVERDDGNDCHYMVSLNPIKYTNNHSAVSMIIKDITKLKQNEIQIRSLMSELEASNQELQSFAYIASHDLKEPLRGIKNYAHILKDDYHTILDESGMNFLNSLIKSCTRMETLLESLLHYSKVGNLQLSLQVINPNQTVADVKDTIHHLLAQKHATVDVVANLPNVYTDESRLSEVFTNLITNGLKYNDSANPHIEIGHMPDKSTEDYFCFYVKDNGIGIEKEKLETVFQIFQRLHKKTDYGGGAGAGLTITKRIVERMKGSLWIESEPGKGSTFYFSLLKPKEAQQNEAENGSFGVNLLISSTQEGNHGDHQSPSH